MSLLTDQDRAYILEQLKLAPDSVLADAMLAFNAIRDKVVMVRKLTEQPSTLVEEANPSPRPNVSPGVPSIVKIGAETKATLIKELVQGRQPPAKFAEHMKLLWERGEVNFDGKEYWI